MKVVYKYQLSLATTRLEMPACAQFLTVQMQGRDPYLWALIDTDMPRTERQVIVVGTGHDMPRGDWAYIATFQNGPYVWHAFVAE